MQKPGGDAHNSERAEREAAERDREAPDEGIAAHGEGADPEAKDLSIGAEVKPRILYVHKGDVGRPGVNDEIYQGSKTRELG